MDGPETMIALSAVARNSGPIALILLWGPSKSHSVGVVEPHKEHSSGPLSSTGLSTSPPFHGQGKACLIQKYEWLS